LPRKPPWRGVRGNAPDLLSLPTWRGSIKYRFK
jgi:hypothetical protein